MNRVGTWTTEQREVHALLSERYGYGLGVEIARRLGVTLARVYGFYRGAAQFPESELAKLRSFLLEWVDPQVAVRAELVAWLAQRRGRGTAVAQHLGINKATISRFRDAAVGLSPAHLDALAAYLRASGNNECGDRPGAAPSSSRGSDEPRLPARPRAKRVARPRPVVALPPEEHPVYKALLALAIGFGWALVREAARATMEDLDARP